MTKIDIKQLEKSANLKLSGDERDAIESQLNEALDAVNILEEASNEEVNIIQHPTGLRNITREDKIKDSLTQEEALSNAKRTYKGYFVTSAVLDHK